MALSVEPYREQHQPAVQEFNQRLQAAGAGSEFVFYKSSRPHWLPASAESAVYNEYFVALDGAVVRGAYALKHEKIFVRGRGLQSVACYHHALSEGIINRSYAAVGGMMLRDALIRQPELYALGMGGYSTPLARMLAALAWKFYLVPFYFRVVRPHRFLKQMQALRQTDGRRLLMDIAAATGVGWAAIKIAQNAIKVGTLRPGAFSVEDVPDFGAWVDPLWSQAADACSMAAVRDSATLRQLYPAADRHFTRLRISRNSTAIGWAVVGQRRQDPKFGDMRVGSIIDCWAMPNDGLSVLRAASQPLEAQGMDLIVCNHGHQAWRRAFRSAGFLKGPSNFIFAASKKLSELLQPFEQNKCSFHITRADGDGLPRNF